jgi:hypothetical protein
VNEEWNGKCLRQVEHIRGHYPRILFRLDMGLVYHPAHRRLRELNISFFSFDQLIQIFVFMFMYSNITIWLWF